MHGDAAARHAFVAAPGAVTALIDWESARGGDPLADVAAFTIREHLDVAAAFTTAYFPEPPEPAQRWALTVHRIRIAAALTRFHHDHGEHAPAARLAHVLADDLAAAHADHPTVLPVHSCQEHPPSWR
ncbi:phosphotransferase [Yinghuangia aomiensis]